MVSVVSLTYEIDGLSVYSVWNIIIIIEWDLSVTCYQNKLYYIDNHRKMIRILWAFIHTIFHI